MLQSYTISRNLEAGSPSLTFTQYGTLMKRYKGGRTISSYLSVSRLRGTERATVRSEEKKQ